MKEIRELRNQVTIYSVIAALIIWVISLPFLKINTDFLYGLVLGTSVAIVLFYVLILTSKLVINSGKPFIASLSMILRLCVYGLAFYNAMQLSYIAGIAVVAGFLTQKIAIYYIHIKKPKRRT